MEVIAANRENLPDISVFRPFRVRERGDRRTKARPAPPRRRDRTGEAVVRGAGAAYRNSAFTELHVMASFGTGESACTSTTMSLKSLSVSVPTTPP